MATVAAVILKHHKKQDGTFNVKIRITHKGSTVYIDTNIYAGKSDVDTKIRLKKVFIDTYLTSTVNDYRKKLNALGAKVDYMSASDIKEYFSLEDEVIDFIKFADENVQGLIQSNRKSTGLRRKTSVTFFKRFLNKTQFSVDLITSKLLREFEKYLFDNKYAVNTVRNTMADIRAIFNEAKDVYNNEELGIVRIHNSPFSKYSPPESPESRKKGLEISTHAKSNSSNMVEIDLKEIVDTIKFIRDVHIENTADSIARDLFMLSFYMCGTNANDFHAYLLDKNIERFGYNRNKTRGKRKDKAFISIKVTEEAKPLVEKYAGYLQERYALPKAINNRLSDSFKLRLGDVFGIPNFTYYHARHFFATLAGFCGYDDFDIQRALNQKTNTMAAVYTARDWSKIDEIQRAVLDLLKDEAGIHD
ncbi:MULTISPECIES: phage integrase SAM-like domain-containing protein [Sphingobacterium]|uniref:phage integrase SAM-like domain-containing protein n=1 Tax=Sphingobacterium TaxID=28453 RepID=UPI00257C9845|nr:MULTISPECIES: phage integrase SAM-like domain-containing protein [Sphingobacterium]